MSAERSSDDLRKPAPDNIASDVRATLSKGARALAQLARFESFILGDRLCVLGYPALLSLRLQQRGTRRQVEASTTQDSTYVNHQAFARLDQCAVLLLKLPQSSRVFA